MYMYNICRECRPGMQECVITYLHRQSTTGIAEKKFKHKCPKVLENWLKNPIEDWELVQRMLDYVENKM